MQQVDKQILFSSDSLHLSFFRNRLYTEILLNHTAAGNPYILLSRQTESQRMQRLSGANRVSLTPLTI